MSALPHLAPYQYKPGQSGNPAGKPPGMWGLIRYLREKTKNGKELIDKLLEVARGEHALFFSGTDRIKALTYLCDKVLPYVDDGPGPVLDGDKLTDSERVELAAINARVRAIAAEVNSRANDQPA